MSKYSQNSRDQILDALTSPSGRTASELSLQCGIGEPAVRFHLRNLLKSGLICSCESQTWRNHPGRKYQRYRRNNFTPYSNINQLSVSLLEILFGLSKNNHTEVFRTLAISLTGTDIPDGQTEIKRMNDAIIWLNRHKYAAVWEAGQKGPIVRFRNCPYRDLGVYKNSFCSLDAIILETITGKFWEVEKTLCWESINGECEFVVDPSRVK